MIPTRIDTTIDEPTVGAVFVTGGGTNYLIEIPNGSLYMVYIDVNSDGVFKKSTDYGYTWSVATVLKAMTCTQLAVWCDYWTDPTGVLGGLIHVAYSESVSDSVYYRTIDTNNADALGTERNPWDGSSTAAGGAISISRMIGGNIIIAGSIDAGVETYAYKSNDLFETSSAIANPYEASPDRLIMMPGWGADTNDAMCFYYDNSAQEISVKYYDDSANSWSETSIATTIVHPDHTSTTLGHWSATVNHANSQNLLAFWTAIDTANADLRVFKVTQSAQTETASNVVLNSTDDQGFCGITIQGVNWYVFYLGKSDGTESYSSSLNSYYKITSDGGVNWGSETKNSIYAGSYITYIVVSPISYKTLSIVYYLAHNNGAPQGIVLNTRLAIPHTTFQLGM